MQLQLQMVGHFKNKTVRIKGHLFEKGLCTMNVGADYAAGITQYLSHWGAYPVVEAEQRQALLDASQGKEVSTLVADGRVERLEIQLAMAKREQAELREIKKQNEARLAAERQEKLEIEAATQVMVKQKLAQQKAAAEELLARVEVEEENALSDIGSALEAGGQKEEDSSSFRGGKNKNK